VRHIQSGNYYARIRVRGKLIWKSLKTDRISIAKLPLGDFHKEQRQLAAAHTAVARGKMTFGAVLETFRQRLMGDYALKERSKTYRQERIAALLKSWPNLETTDVTQFSKTDCLAWAWRFGQKGSPSASITQLARCDWSWTSLLRREHGMIIPTRGRGQGICGQPAYACSRMSGRHQFGLQIFRDHLN
jgi:hypothetical protein